MDGTDQVPRSEWGLDLAGGGMDVRMENGNVEAIEIALLLDTLHRRYGYDFSHYARASIRRRVRHIVAKNGYTQISELIPRLLRDEQFAQAVIGDFSVTVTEMFRDPDFYRSLQRNVFPYLQTFPFINVWHAGCASGEEVYSLAILLQEGELYERATIFATDFNETALLKAQEGIYPLRHMRQYTANYQQAGGARSFADYYHAQYELAMMDPALKSHVTFVSHNLVTDGVFTEAHLIFCRNVLIYFDRGLQNRVLRLLTDSLINGGFLCLGNKETLEFSDVQDRFRVVDEIDKIYQKHGV